MMSSTVMSGLYRGTYKTSGTAHREFSKARNFTTWLEFKNFIRFKNFENYKDFGILGSFRMNQSDYVFGPDQNWNHVSNFNNGLSLGIISFFFIETRSTEFLK